MSTNSEVEVIKPPITDVGILGWVKGHLFNGAFNSTATILILLVASQTVPQFLQWAFIDSVWFTGGKECHEASGACWSVVTQNIRFNIFGYYPYEHQWRPLVAMIILVSMLLYSRDWNKWDKRLGYIRHLNGENGEVYEIVPRQFPVQWGQSGRRLPIQMIESHCVMLRAVTAKKILPFDEVAQGAREEAGLRRWRWRCRPAFRAARRWPSGGLRCSGAGRGNRSRSRPCGENCTGRHRERLARWAPVLVREPYGRPQVVVDRPRRRCSERRVARVLGSWPSLPPQ